MYKIILVAVLLVVCPSFLCASMVKDKELNEIGMRMQKQAEMEALSNLMQLRPRVVITDGDRARLAAEEATATTPKYRDNPKGFVDGKDYSVLCGFKQKAIESPEHLVVTKYFTLNVGRGETATKTFDIPGSLVVWIPKDANQYVVEVAYFRNGTKVSEDYGVAESQTYISGPKKGEVLEVKVTRAPDFGK